MDEYEGLDKNHPQSFGCFLNEHIFSKLPFKTVNYISDYGIEYEKLLKENHIDVVVLGIGENGHIAFNDPGVADFNDPKMIEELNKRILAGDNHRELIEQYINITELNRETVEVMIDHIVVGRRIKGTKNYPVEIYWNF